MNREPTPDFSNPATRKSFADSAQDHKSLAQKELSVNRAEQVLIQKRIRLMHSLANDLPSSDPEYSQLLIQVQMDQIEIDELKIRETLLIQKLSE